MKKVKMDIDEDKLLYDIESIMKKEYDLNGAGSVYTDLFNLCERLFKDRCILYPHIIDANEDEEMDNHDKISKKWHLEGILKLASELEKCELTPKERAICDKLVIEKEIYKLNHYGVNNYHDKLCQIAKKYKDK